MVTTVIIEQWATERERQESEERESEQDRERERRGKNSITVFRHDYQHDR